MSDDSSVDWRKLNRRRGANEDWREVFFLIYRRFNFLSFTIIDVLEFAEKFGIRITKESLRVKLAKYVKLGVLSKEGRGMYKLTDKSDDYFQIRKRVVSTLKETNNEEG